MIKFHWFVVFGFFDQFSYLYKFFLGQGKLKIPFDSGNIWSMAFQKKKTELKNLSQNSLSDKLKTGP